MSSEPVAPPSEVYASIGEFVVRFSQMLHEMEVCRHSCSPEDEIAKL